MRLLTGTFVSCFVLSNFQIPRADAQRAFPQAIPRGKKLTPLQQRTQLLHTLVEKMPHTERGDEHTALSATKYNICGIVALQGAPGTKEKVGTSKLREEERNAVLKIARTMEGLLCDWLSTGLVSGVRAAKKLLGFQSFHKNGFASALATGVNHCTLIHTDVDFFPTILIVTAEEVVVDKAGQPVVALYFCFPTKGVAVGLAVGDAIIFNPTIEHCCSYKSAAYANVDVYTTCEYTKTAVVGLNDNSIGLTAQQKKMRKIMQSF